MTADIVFMDTEALGLEVDAPVWEFAAIRRGPDGTETDFRCFIDHDPTRWLPEMPDAFRRDYLRRYDPAVAVTAHLAGQIITKATKDAHVVGAVPSFDTERLSRLLDRVGRYRAPWHYHLIDIENVVVGYLAGTSGVLGALPPYRSDDLSRAIGVNPDDFVRHTAMGDAKWVRAQWDTIVGHS